MKSMTITPARDFAWADVPEPGSTLRSRTSAEKAQIPAGLVREVWPALEAGTFAPHVHAVLPITEAAEAHRILEAGESRGKVVLTI